MYSISVMELVSCLSEIIDLMGDEVSNHHKRVTCCAYQLAEACGINGTEKRDLIIAAALHDIGGFSLLDRVNAALHFEDTNAHAEKGYRLLKTFPPFKNIANFVRYHHTAWNHGQSKAADGQPISITSQIILLADRIAVSLESGIRVLTTANMATKQICEQSGSIFNPGLVKTFQQVSQKDIFWLNIVAPSFYNMVMGKLKQYDLVFSGEHFDKMLIMLSNIIDFRSQFTVMHSKGVAAVAESLAKYSGFPEDECKAIKIAALLHDIGKLAIPGEILNKPGPLTSDERCIIRTHPFYTDRIISCLHGLPKIQKLASLHHESLNGGGYPFGLVEASEELTLGARIMNVADIFIALIEERPYRKAILPEQAVKILQGMSSRGETSHTIVEILASNSQEITLRCLETKAEAGMEYKKFLLAEPILSFK